MCGRRCRRGGILVEFGIGVMLFLTVLLGTLEWSLEMILRHSTERAAVVAVQSLADDGDPVAAQVAVMKKGTLYRACDEPLRFRFFDTIKGIDLTASGTGYAPTGALSDESAVWARVEVSCSWHRLTPVGVILFGDTMQHETVAFARLPR